MGYEMGEFGPTITVFNIRALEKKLSLKLPATYKAFLLKNNGGRPKPNTAYTIQGWENNEKGDVHFFLGIGYAGHGFSYDLEEDYKTLRDRIPRNLFPIATTDFGDFILLSLSGADKGSVHIWDHEKEHCPPTYANIYKIADSFTA